MLTLPGSCSCSCSYSRVSCILYLALVLIAHRPPSTVDNTGGPPPPAHAPCIVHCSTRVYGHNRKSSQNQQSHTRSRNPQPTTHKRQEKETRRETARSPGAAQGGQTPAWLLLLLHNPQSTIHCAMPQSTEPDASRKQQFSTRNSPAKRQAASIGHFTQTMHDAGASASSWVSNG